MPKKSQERTKRLLELASDERTIVFYEAPHRIAKTLKALKDTLGNRRAVIAREMTKIHEEFIRGPLEELIQRFEEIKPKGEMVIVVEGAKADSNAPDGQGAVLSEHDVTPEELKGKLESIIKENIAQGHTKNQALKIAAEKLGLSRNEAYDLLIDKLD